MTIDKLDPASFRPIVGIDLGTTNSAVAYIHDGRPQVIPSEAGEQLLASVVLLDPEGQVIVGQDARDGLVAMPDRAIAAVKRLMGNSDPLKLGSQTFLPEEISALILKELRQRLVPIYGDQVIEAVITVPAYFNDAQRRATKQAGELAGFVVERIINEPTAAALAYGLDHSEVHKHVLVYDLGGGTFDVSVVTLENGVLEVKASNGNRRLGGEDFDWRLVDWMAEQVYETSGVDPRNDLRARAILKELAEHAKWTLSNELEATVESPLLMMHDDRAVMLQTKVHRDQFVTMIQPWLDETFTLVVDVLQQAGLSPDAIDEVLLVGGSTRIPRVQEMVAQYFGRPARSEVDPELVVALGAAVQAGIKSGALSNSGIVATDVAPFSMGIATARPFGYGWRPGYFAPIIKRNTAIPCTQTQIFTTLSDGQNAIEVEVYQGEDELVANNYNLGSFLLNGIPAAPAGTEKIEVTFRYNLNGILEATARIVSTKHVKSIVVQDGLERHSASALEQSRARLEALWDNMLETQPVQTSEDEEFPDVFEIDDETLNDKDFAMDLADQVETTMKDLEVLMRETADKAERKRLVSCLEKIKGALTSEDPNTLQEAIDEALDLLFDLES
jgi:molecular chaperone DnaK